MSQRDETDMWYGTEETWTRNHSSLSTGNRPQIAVLPDLALEGLYLEVFLPRNGTPKNYAGLSAGAVSSAKTIL